MPRKRSAPAAKLALRSPVGRPGRWRRACARRRSTSSSGRSICSGPGKPLRDAIERGAPGSMIFWGPPGSGKTTLAHLVASIHRPGVRAVQRGDRRRAAHPGDHHRSHGRGSRPGASRPSSSWTRSTVSTRPSRTACFRRPRMVPSPDRRDHREPQLRGHRRATLAHPGLRAAAAPPEDIERCCSAPLADTERGLGTLG